MAETPEDKNVDQIISDLQSTLDRLKAAQAKDVKDEDLEEGKEVPRDQQPRTLSDAAVRVRSHMRRMRARQDAQK